MSKFWSPLFEYWEDESAPFETRMAKLNELINKSHNIVFFGGAGVSTESGVPDFRSKDGLYNQHDIQFDKYSPEFLLSRECLFNKSKMFYEFYRQKMNCSGVKPNITHIKLSELERTGHVSAIVTQNIDGLHQMAGSQNVYEIHGTTTRCYCAKCKKEYPADYIFKSTDAIPKCTNILKPGNPEKRRVCGGLIRPDVTLYGENLPDKAVFNAIQALENADLLIIGGTSLMVEPAASMLSHFYGENRVVINKTPTSEDRYATLVFHENLGEVFSHVVIK